MTQIYIICHESLRVLMGYRTSIIRTQNNPDEWKGLLGWKSLEETYNESFSRKKRIF